MCIMTCHESDCYSLGLYSGIQVIRDHFQWQRNRANGSRHIMWTGHCLVRDEGYLLRM